MKLITIVLLLLLAVSLIACSSDVNQSFEADNVSSDSAVNSPSDNSVSLGDCPFGRSECDYPGDCPRFVDSDKDGSCDHTL